MRIPNLLENWETAYFGLLVLVSLYALASGQYSIISFPAATLFSLIALSVLASGLYAVIFFFAGLRPSLGAIYFSFIFSGIVFAIFLYFLNMALSIYDVLDDGTKAFLSSIEGSVLFLISLGIMINSPSVNLKIFSYEKNDEEKQNASARLRSFLFGSLCNKLLSSSVLGAIAAISLSTILMLFGKDNVNIWHRFLAALLFASIFAQNIQSWIKKAVSPIIQKKISQKALDEYIGIFLVFAFFILSFFVSIIFFQLFPESTKTQQLSIAIFLTLLLLFFLHFAKIPKWYFNAENEAPPESQTSPS
ncbi:MAG: hypothetical protein N3G80_02925 [Candidatus Micrarchaeota archaeon]|nr:hypothetical protein [Candidatus Micrarchaeota archaeon]